MREEDYYGAEAQSENKLLRDRLRERYVAEDFVTVINIDTEPLTYQFATPNDTEVINAPYEAETIVKARPKKVTLQPGEMKLCPAYEADLMIENLIKKLAIRKTADKIKDGVLVAGQAANWNDPQFQEELIDEIYLGKEDLVGKYNKELPQKEERKVTPESNGRATKPHRPVSRKAI